MIREKMSRCFFCEYDYGPKSKKERPCGDCIRHSKFQLKKRMNNAMAIQYKIFCNYEKRNICPNCGSTQCDNITAEHIMDLHEMVSINYFCGCLSCGTLFIPKEYRNRICEIKEVKRRKSRK